MAEAPVTRKRAVAASRTRAATRAPRAAVPTTTPAVARTTAAPKAPARKAAARVAALDDEQPITNYALRLTEDDGDEDVWVPPVRPRALPSSPTPVDTFEARMSEALRAISAAQANAEPTSARRKSFSATEWLKALDKLPPIRLPIGPAVPWRVGLPALVAVVAVMFLVSRPDTSRADAQGVRLPAQETYAVQQEAPLFSTAAAAPADEAAQADAPAPTPAAPAAKPIGVPEPAGASFDFLDLGFKLIAVLALAYGSLVLLKRAGLGGNAAAGGGNGLQGMRVVSSLALAPNRSIHVIRVPGGRTLLVGATPTAVNLLADLGVLAEDETPEASSLLNVVKGLRG